MSVKDGFCKQNSTGKKLDHQYGQRSKGCTIRSCDFRLPKRYELVSPMRYLKHVVEKVAAAVGRLAAAASKSSDHNRNHNIKERAAAKTSVAAPAVDCQRAEAIHDCIDFIHSSLSLPTISHSNSLH